MFEVVVMGGDRALAGEECVFMYHFRETLTATGGVLHRRTGQAICRPRDCRSSYCPAWRAKGQGYGVIKIAKLSIINLHLTLKNIRKLLSVIS